MVCEVGQMGSRLGLIDYHKAELEFGTYEEPATGLRVAQLVN